MFELGLSAAGSSLGFQGEDRFLSGMVFGRDEKLAKNCSRKLRKEILELPYALSPITDKRVTDCLVEMFRVHKKYAARLHRDPGAIGEPYVIYKITPEKVERLRRKERRSGET